MRVFIPTPLRSYTNQSAEVTAGGQTLADLFGELDNRFPGIRFRVIDEQGAIRQHIKVFVNQEQVHELAERLQPTDEVHIICALSGG